MITIMNVKFWLKSAGYCTSHQHFALRGSKRKTIRFPATYGLIHHPVHGWILFDTGYTRRFFEGTQRFPGSIYGRLTPVFIQPEEEVVSALRESGIKPEEIKHIIISHFHADHTGGMLDFPQARFYASPEALEQVNSVSGFQAVRRGILTNQIPRDLMERSVPLTEENFSTKEDPHLGTLIDLFDDGSILLVSLPGHAKGQMGAILQTESQHVFLIADACWLKETWQENRLPHPVVKLFFDSWTDFTDSLTRIQNYHQANPETVIIPCHCQDTVNEIMSLQAEIY